MTMDIRKTGIASVGDVPWGTHFCHFYETQEDLFDILIPYFQAGLEHNEFCMWVISPPIHEDEAKNTLRRMVPNVDRNLAAGDIEIVPHTQWYLKGGTFDLQRVIHGWYQKLTQALAKGYVGMRVNGLEAWLMEMDKDWKNFTAYEKELNSLMANQPIIVLCTYPLTKTKAGELFDVARTHQFVIAKRNGHWEVLETPELRQIKAELLTLNQGLEQRIADRTTELTAINLELRKEIVNRKHAEEALRQERDFVDTLLQTLGALVIVLDRKGRVVRFNRACEQASGYTFQEVEGKLIFDLLLLPEEAEGAKEVFKKITTGGFPCSHENQWMTRDGKRRLFSWSNTVFTDDQGQVLYVIGTGIDITERRQAEEALRRLNEELEHRVEERTTELARANAALRQSEENLHFLTSQTLSAQEKERKRIAHELHDGLGQSLTVLKLQLRTIQRMMPPTGHERVEFESALNFVNGIIEDTRRLSRALSPSMLEDLGLPMALRQLFNETCKLQEIDCIFNADDINALFSLEAQIIIYRIFQEILNNITKHSKATRIEMEIKKWNGRIQFSVTDNGIGFDVSQTMTGSLKDRGMGLAYVEEQVRMLSGVMDIRSKKGEGTRINITIPC